MKKLLALLLVAMLALTGTLALAEEAAAPVEEAAAPVEEAAAPEFKGLTVTGSVTIDRDGLGNLLKGMGLESIAPVIDAVAAICNEGTETVVVAPDGLEYDLSVKGQSLINMAAAMDEAGITLVSNLIPGHAVTLSVESIMGALLGMVSQATEATDGLDTNGVQIAFGTYMNDFSKAVSAAIVPGDPVAGDYVLDGITFNYAVPVEVDTYAIVNAAQETIYNIFSDETILTFLEGLKDKGINISVDSPEDLNLNFEEVPEVKVNFYMNLDETTGEQNGPTEVEVKISDATGEVMTMGYVLVDGQNVDADFQFLSAGMDVKFVFQPSETGATCSLDYNIDNSLYIGFVSTYDTANDINFDTDLYVMDREKPLVCERATIVMEGQLSAPVSTEGKTVVAIESLMGDESGDAASNLLTDLLTNGLLGNVVGTLSQAMPDEFNAIFGLFMGGDTEQLAG